MSEQIITIILSGLILIINTFFFFWLNSIRLDVRDLRVAYLNAVTDALKCNGELKVEIEKLNGTIDGLKIEIGYLKESLAQKTN